jgi:hypothetical protein
MEVLAALIILGTLLWIGVMAAVAWIGDALIRLVQPDRERRPVHAGGPPVLLSSGQGKHRPPGREAPRAAA